MQPRTRLLLLVALLSGPCIALAQTPTRAECERDYRPQVGQAGKDVVWVPTPDEIVERMLDMAQLKPADVLVDLGAGDGKIAIAAGRRGASATGIEYNPDMARLAQCLVHAAGMGDTVRVIEGDIFKEDFSKASVVTMYLLPELNLRLRPTLLAMKPGTRIASHQFTMGDWEPDDKAQADSRSAYLWIVPAPVAGLWNLRSADGKTRLALRLEQKYQKLTGEIRQGERTTPLASPGLRGDELRFGFVDAHGVTHSFRGRVVGGELSGVARGDNGAELRLTGARQ